MGGQRGLSVERTNEQGGRSMNGWILLNEWPCCLPYHSSPKPGGSRLHTSFFPLILHSPLVGKPHHFQLPDILKSSLMAASLVRDLVSDRTTINPKLAFLPLVLSSQTILLKTTGIGCSSQMVQFSSIQSLSRVRLFATPWTAAHQASLSITNSQSLSKFMSLSRWCHPTISSSVILFSSCPQSIPASGSLQMSQFFASGGQSFGVSASTSVLPMNTQYWSPLGWTGWISLQSKGLSRVFSNTTIQRHHFFGTQLSLYSPTLTSIHDYWKDHSFD